MFGDIMQGRTDDGLTANSLFPDVQKAYDKIWATGYEKRCGKIRSEETCVMTNKMTEYARGVVILDGHKSTSQVGRTPPLHNWGSKNHCGDTEQCRTPHKVSTTSQFGTLNDVLQWSMSPQRCFKPTL